jgi:hypothetical protein
MRHCEDLLSEFSLYSFRYHLSATNRDESRLSGICSPPYITDINLALRLEDYCAVLALAGESGLRTKSYSFRLGGCRGAIYRAQWHQARQVSPLQRNRQFPKRILYHTSGSPPSNCCWISWRPFSRIFSASITFCSNCAQISVMVLTVESPSIFRHASSKMR